MDRDTVIVACGEPEPPVMMIYRGTAYRSVTMADGRRAIVDILLPSDIVGTDHAYLARSNHDIVAGSLLGYRLLAAATRCAISWPTRRSPPASWR